MHFSLFSTALTLSSPSSARLWQAKCQELPCRMQCKEGKPLVRLSSSTESWVPVGWIVYPSSHVKARSLVPQNMTVLGERTFEEVIMVEWSHQHGPWLQRAGVLLRRGTATRDAKAQRKGQVRTAREDTAGKPRSSPREKPNLRMVWSRISSL